MKMQRRTSSGFTLIELMIVVAIVAVLSSLAYPSFKEYIAKGRRAEAKAVLMSAQQWMERLYTESYRYDKNSAGTAVGDIFPAHLKRAPADGTANYTVGLADGTTTDTFLLQAAPTGGMAGDKCGTYQVDQYGRKSLKASTYKGFANEAAAMEYCWK